MGGLSRVGGIPRRRPHDFCGGSSIGWGFHRSTVPFALFQPEVGTVRRIKLYNHMEIRSVLSPVMRIVTCED